MFNDPFAAADFAALVAANPVGTIFETGTHTGEGALACASHAPVVTIEVNDDFRRQAFVRWGMAGFEHVAGYKPEAVFAHPDGRRIHSFFGSSPDVLEAVLAWGKLDRPYLFFLDAHWHDYWPLLDELRTIARHGLADSLIVIHDFEVPGKPFGFDTYKGQALNLDYVRADLAAINPGYLLSYNERASADSTGRGILYAVPPKIVRAAG